ncbi:hypothetical protein OF83DRAFT_1288737 [Amylostereum chailletii]|nr:hypothetical protein OF83DRAFT_1288737 [Amylostereum chailletii]
MSGIPTPGRLRSTSSASQHSAHPGPDNNVAMSRAFQDAVKANDPAQHRAPAGRVSDFTGVSLSPDSKTFLAQSGRRSVTGRPPSVASSSSNAGSTPTAPRYSTARARTPSARPASRQSDIFTRSSSRLDGPFEVGDNVRIESLGFEGTLRYVGAIEGKAGVWAGVELSGGFAGKGKNDGAVDGYHYFRCPPKCGVFVATSKLSAPTVGTGAISRPSSVASSRGRVTPSLSGRVTPSSSVGRRTPYGTGASSGRVTPASSSSRMTQRTPSARTRAKTGPVTGNGPASFTPDASNGSANLSRSGSLTSASPTTRQFSTNSPTRSMGTIPTSASSSPSAKTPKPPNGTRLNGLGIGLPSTTPTKSRPTMLTPRGRIPSAIAMPPPSSPASASRHAEPMTFDDINIGGASPDEPSAALDIELNGHAIQGMIVDLRTSISPHEGGTSQVQSQLTELEFENQRLQVLVNSFQGEELENSRRSDGLREDRDRALARAAELEASVKSIERSLHERDIKIESIETQLSEAMLDAATARTEGALFARDIQAKLDKSEETVKVLQESIELQEGEGLKRDAILKTKDAEITVLEARLQGLHAELEEERKELGGQVDALREAGQETIALYEERLSEADSRRYELEDEISSLQEKLRIQAEPSSPASKARMLSSAAEIENESLRDQIAHLQKKAIAQEDMLEEARAVADREELVIGEKLKRYKEKEDGLRKQLSDKEKEVERVMKSEATARARIEEIEEGFRESTVALENAQAEIEGLRAEIVNLEGHVANATPHKSESSVTRPKGPDDSMSQDDLQNMVERLSLENAELEGRLQLAMADLDMARKKSNRDIPISETLHMSSSSTRSESATLREEIAGLKHIIQELQKEITTLCQQNKLLESENKLLLSETEQLREDMKVLEDNVENSLLREEQHLSVDMVATDGDPVAVQTIQDLKLKHEVELEQLRKRQSEVEMKAARTIHDLNKEVSELEGLIESKIYREDELEQEVERLKEKISRTQRKLSKGALDVNRTADTVVSQTDDGRLGVRADICEICEQPGHDIFTCDVLKGDSMPSSAASSSTSSELYCGDCETYGHLAVDCPHSMDVF